MHEASMSDPRRVNTDLPRHVTKTPKGAYKYQRRVPLELQTFLGRTVWDKSLGSDATIAVRRGLALTDEHDALIHKFKTPEARDAHTDFRQTVLDTFEAENRDEGVEAWRQTPDTMKQVRSLPARAERDRLAVFAAQAFGDGGYMARTPVQDPGLTMVLTIETESLSRPSDPTDGMIWDAYRAALAARLDQLVPDTRVDKSLCIKELMEVYSATKRPQTRRAYTDKIRRLTDAQGNHPPAYYTKDRFQEHRDFLLKEGVGAPTIAKHFETFKTLWRWAVREKSALAGLTFPDIVMPDITTTVEDTRWQAFDDDQIKQVWNLLNVAWGPDSDSGLSPSRRAAFLMGFRVLLHTGMRPVELFHLKADSVKNGELHIGYTKTNTARRIPLAAALSDLPDFLATGGFAAELEAGKTAVRQGKVYGQATKPDSLARAYTTAFSAVIRAGGLTNDRHVLYSAKDTLVDRLQRQGATDDVIRGIIGHVGGQGKLRHYKTPLGHSQHGMEQMRKALDAITYW
jgi:hypothetical protein